MKHAFTPIRCTKRSLWQWPISAETSSSRSSILPPNSRLLFNPRASSTGFASPRLRNGHKQTLPAKAQRASLSATAYGRSSVTSNRNKGIYFYHAAANIAATFRPI